jgi:hypothetical protein
MTVFFGIDVAKEKLDCAVVVHDRQRPIGLCTAVRKPSSGAPAFVPARAA